MNEFYTFTLKVSRNFSDFLTQSFDELYVPKTFEISPKKFVKMNVSRMFPDFLTPSFDEWYQKNIQLWYITWKANELWKI